MRKLFVVAALTGLALGAGPALAQRARDEGPRAPCRSQAMMFDQKVSHMMMPGMTGMSEKVASATQMRNQGMEACQAGRVQEGRAQIEQATSSLGM
jgi:hypothetical protein